MNFEKIGHKIDCFIGFHSGKPFLNKYDEVCARCIYCNEVTLLEQKGILLFPKDRFVENNE